MAMFCQVRPKSATLWKAWTERHVGSMRAACGRHMPDRNNYQSGMEKSAVPPIVATAAGTHQESKQGACVICMDKLANIVCLPCKHLALCTLCDAQQKVQLCPICRSAVQEKMPIFMP